VVNVYRRRFNDVEIALRQSGPSPAKEHDLRKEWRQLLEQKAHGVSRKVKRGVVDKLEAAGLIKVERRRGKSPLITLLHR
jgi:hypothetical protein